MLVCAHEHVCETDGWTQRKRERDTTCRLWPATESGKLICGEREIRERVSESGPALINNCMSNILYKDGILK